ncbi:hypothetical protein D3C80_1313770 [compost metagenome]
MLGTIAVMHVPVEHCDFAQAVFGLGTFDGDRNIGQKAKAHRLVRQAVVAGWARQRIGVFQLSLQYRLDGGAGQPGGQFGYFITARPQRSFLSQHAAAVVA